MTILYSEKFKKNFKKLPQKIKDQFETRLDIFIKDPSNSILKIHPLKGYLTGLRAFSITGDYRVIYRILNQESVKFINIGTHSNIYN